MVEHNTGDFYGTARSALRNKPLPMGDIETQIKAVGLKHSELVRLLAEIEDVRPALKEQEVALTDLKSQKTESDLKLENLDESRKTHLREHGKYRNSFMRRLLYKAGGKQDMFAEKKEKEQRDYLDAVQQAQEEQDVNWKLKEEMDKAQKKHQALESTVQRRSILQKQLHELHESIFAGPTPGFPKEDAKEATVKECVGIFRRVKAQDETQATAVKVLDEASQAMTFALNHLDQALRHRRAAALQSSLVQNDFEATAAVRLAEQGVQCAKEKVTQLPPSVAVLPKVSIEMSSMKASDALDRLLGELSLQVELERGREDAARCAVAINDGLEQARMRKRALASELRRAEGEVEKAKLDLQKERQRIFKKVLSGGKSRRDSSRADTPLPT
ncbi:hypothetical protein B0T10DRAFT_267124 [Thelonectria olida]|uniref:Uncharacterized protein n=1 Tax=Thelonectria olida TaxID=1576542 RepID=A0A9P8W9V7_9HYPO|nr:hypothetical protein B0T10DRAFT_267124 [Thelonectria olida]